jgi:hypothetical protein
MNSPESVFDFYKLKKGVTESLYWFKIVRTTNPNNMYFIEKYIELLKDIYVLKQLSCNPFAVEMLSRHPEKIVWNEFVKNPNAVHIIDKYFDLCFQSLNKHGKQELLKHPNFVHLIEKYQQKMVDELLFIDCIPDILEINKAEYFGLFEKYLEKYPEKIEEIKNTPLSCFWRGLCQNPYAIHIIEENLHIIPNNYWASIAKNENAIHLIEKNLDKLNYTGLNSKYQYGYVCWDNLSENPAAISLLKKNIDRISWEHLVKNPNAMQIYEDYPERMWDYLCHMNYENFSVTTPIFELDYDAIGARCAIYKEELMQVALHPSRIEHYLDMGITIEELDNYI